MADTLFFENVVSIFARGAGFMLTVIFTDLELTHPLSSTFDPETLRTRLAAASSSPQPHSRL